MCAFVRSLKVYYSYYKTHHNLQKDRGFIDESNFPTELIWVGALFTFSLACLIFPMRYGVAKKKKYKANNE